MICFHTKHYDLEDTCNNLRNELQEARVKISSLEAEIRFTGVHQALLKEIMSELREDKRLLLDDLLIASGVKMSEMQKHLIEREMTQAEETPSYTGQASQWSQQMTQQGLKESHEFKNKRSLEIMDLLEKQAGLNIPDSLREVS